MSFRNSRSSLVTLRVQGQPEPVSKYKKKGLDRWLSNWESLAAIAEDLGSAHSIHNGGLEPSVNPIPGDPKG